MADPTIGCQSRRRFGDYRILDAIDFPNTESCFAELAANETDEKAIQIVAHGRRGIDHARTLVGIRGVRSIQADLGLTMMVCLGHGIADEQRSKSKLT